MTNGKTLKLLREWDGDKNSMPRMTTVRMQKPIDTTQVAVDNKNEKTRKDMMEL
jgi:translation machinery-associated protein 16